MFILLGIVFLSLPQSTGIEKNIQVDTINTQVDTSYALIDTATYPAHNLIDGRFPDTLIIECGEIPGSQ